MSTALTNPRGLTETTLSRFLSGELSLKPHQKEDSFAPIKDPAQQILLQIAHQNFNGDIQAVFREWRVPEKASAFEALQHIFRSVFRKSVDHTELQQAPLSQMITAHYYKFSRIALWRELAGEPYIEKNDIENLSGLEVKRHFQQWLQDNSDVVRQVTKLSLNNSYLFNLSPEIGNLKSLEYLTLTTNKLLTLPQQIGNLSSLKVLWIGGNRLTKLPPEIGNLTSLRTIDVLNNQITELPHQIGNLTSLKVLLAEGNRLTKLPSEIGNLRSLICLRVAHNHIQELPSQIGKLNALEFLDLSSNELFTLSPAIGKLKTLEDLDVSRNDLTTLPAEIQNLTSLKHLMVGKNCITTLPQKIRSLSSLRQLSILYNPLTTTPSETKVARDVHGEEKGFPALVELAARSLFVQRTAQ